MTSDQDIWLADSSWRY